MQLTTLKNTIQSCNINFLLGSGLSRPYLITLGNIETLLEELERSDSPDTLAKDIVKASLYKRYFEEVMLKNLESYKKNKADKKDYDAVLKNYKDFLQSVNTVLLHRYVPIYNKQINLFTTNIDLFFERSLEGTKVEFNDGFAGRLNPRLDLSNFQKSYNKTSLHYQNTSEIPVFNLLKLHGSINWKKEGEQIILSDFDEYKAVSLALAKLGSEPFIEITKESKLATLITNARKKIDEGLDQEELEQALVDFFNAYDQLQIVNPTKEKFKTTLLNNYYYELLRLFANEMEKENTLLFALGFSFADEHVREITIRALNSNPTLQLYAVAHSAEAKSDVEAALGISENRILNGNVAVVDPETFLTANSKDESITKFDHFTFDMINSKIFEKVSKMVNPAINRGS